MLNRFQNALVLVVATVLAVQVCLGKSVAKRDVAYNSDAKKTIEKTLGTWQGGIEKFFHDGIKVDQDVGFMSHNVHEFTSNIAEVGNMFVHTLHKPPSPERISAYSERAKNMTSSINYPTIKNAQPAAPVKVLQTAPITINNNNTVATVANNTAATNATKKQDTPKLH